MKMRLASLKTTYKSPSPVAVEKAKKVERSPEVTLNTRMKGMKNLHECKSGQKYRLTFEAEVKGDRSPEEWEINNEGFKPTDRIVTFKLLTGAAYSEPKSIAQAAEQMKDRSKEA